MSHDSVMERTGPAVEATRLAEVMQEWGTRHPYSTLDIFLGRSVEDVRTEDPRPGVCFTLNTGFAAHLRSTGTATSIHLAGVQDHDSPDKPDVGSHLTVVTELDGVRHLTDVGLGCGPLRPIPLRAGTHAFSGFDFRLTTLERDGQRWWRLGIPDALSRAFTAMEFCDLPDAPRAQARAGHFLSAATSPLRDVLLIQGWDAGRLVTAYGSTVSVRSSEGTTCRRTFSDRDDWQTAVQAWFPGTFADEDLVAAWARLEGLRQ
ncbi:arylamine N-acetyltransferase [Ornithinimicrobium cavernae]|uniref:arylamine N-acetyltransferase n=1 Tax=Ornithinimicrobium cavernae TaxID=2666047 RepID=UPI000D69CFAE|nr:arylamine N-acetyltransferase [Ornithinimicrobium cavernae]